MARAVKFAEGSDDLLEILAIPFGGVLNGRDTDGEYFSPNTDLCPDWFPGSRPLLYHHGLDGGPGVSVIGRVDATSARKADDGWWVQAQLDKANAYHAQIKDLVERGKLYASSGAMPHLVTKSQVGEIQRWPWVELSLTPTPANLLAVVEPIEAAKHYKSAGLDVAAFEAKLTARERNAPIPASGFDGDAPEGTCEDLLQDLNRLLRGGPFGQSPFGGSRGWAYTIATFMPMGDGYAVVRCGTYDDDYGDDSGPLYYRVAFTIGADGEPVLGEAAPLDLAYIPSTTKSGEPLDATPLALAAEHALTTIDAVARRTKDVADRRAREGRALSDGHRQRLGALVQAAKSVTGALEGLLADADPAAEAAAIQRLRLLTLTLDA